MNQNMNLTRNIPLLLAAFTLMGIASFADSSVTRESSQASPLAMVNHRMAELVIKGQLWPSSDIYTKQKTAEIAEPADLEALPTRIVRVVKATAYNALASQTDSTPDICAWGDRIRPGIIAVSRDLEGLGLTRGQEVHIEGHGNMVVLDRMHKRKTNQIDIYMEEYEDAINFGVQQVVISWNTEREEEENG